MSDGEQGAPPTPVLMVGGAADAQALFQTIEATLLGARDVIVRTAHPDAIAEAAGLTSWIAESVGRDAADRAIIIAHGREADMVIAWFAPSVPDGPVALLHPLAPTDTIAPDGIDHVFYTNSGSEAVDTALKIALAYHRARGESSRTRLIGRERGYHGVNFGGISVGGIVANRKMFGTLLTGVDHMRHTHDLSRNAFARGEPEHGIELADDLLRIAQLHDPSTIAAVIVEPVAGSAGVLLPPKGYLKRLREICDEHGILLIFDEVITGYGRLGTNFGADYFGVKPDLMTTAKGLTNGTVPMGAVFAANHIHDAFMSGPDHMIEFFHGYTYSGHPVCAAAALANLEIIEREGLVDRVKTDIGPYLKERWLKLGEHELVGEARMTGLVGALELVPDKKNPTKKFSDVGVPGTLCRDVSFEHGMVMRAVRDSMIISPPLVLSHEEADHLVATAEKTLNDTYRILKRDGWMG